MIVEPVIFDSDKVKELMNDNKKLKTQLKTSNYRSYLKSETATDGDTYLLHHLVRIGDILDEIFLDILGLQV